MAKILNTQNIMHTIGDLSSDETHQIYNGLDCLITREVKDKLEPKFEDNTNASGVFFFEQSLQAPIMEMAQRGILVDQPKRFDMIHEMERQKDRHHLGEPVPEGGRRWSGGASSPAHGI